MDALRALFAEIRSHRDDEGVRALLLDAWTFAQERGEPEGVALARTILSGVREFARHEAMVEGMKKGGAGVLLPPAPPPVSGEWWGLLEDGEVVPGGSKLAKRSLYWCDSPEGWHPIPGAKLRADEARAVPAKMDEGGGLYDDESQGEAA